MNTCLHQLVYLSRNTFRDTPEASALSMDQILNAARRNNARDGITGALLHGGGYFAQALEGPLSALEQTFERIQCDPRHGEVTVLHCAPVPERLFDGWSMADAGALTPEAVAELRLAGALDGPDRPRVDGLVALLQDLLRRQPPPA